jgi:hypothetical protein
MASPAQTRANRQNSKHSTGAKTQAGKQASSQNATTHGLCTHHSGSLYLLEDEDPEKFRSLLARLKEEHQPQTETERILVRRMADHEWLRTRALRLQNACFNPEEVITIQLPLFLRYQSTHERAFYKALNELLKLRAERKKDEIGFVSQNNAAASLELKKEAQILKKQQFEFKKMQFEHKNNRAAAPQEVPQPASTAESSPPPCEMAA